MTTQLRRAKPGLSRFERKCCSERFRRVLDGLRLAEFDTRSIHPGLRDESCDCARSLRCEIRQSAVGQRLDLNEMFE